MRFPVVVLVALAACNKDDTGDDDDDDDDVLTREEFDQAYADRYCAEFEACTTSSNPCGSPAATTEACDFDPVDFDPVAAQACLDGEYVCNADFPGLEYIVPPAVCTTVCG